MISVEKIVGHQTHDIEFLIVFQVLILQYQLLEFSGILIIRINF